MTSDRVPILFKIPEQSTPARWRIALLVVTLCSLAGIVFLASPTRIPSSSLRETISLHSNLPILTKNPIIGIHAHRDPDYGDDFIVASYLKWIESAGGRAVYIPYNATVHELDDILASVNGVLFPGGSGSPNSAAEYIYKKAIAFNQNGSYFPLWGTCLGFEWLIQLQAEDKDILDTVDADNITSVLNFEESNKETSRLLGFSPLFDTLGQRAITPNFHFYGILKSHFDATKKLTSFYNVLGTSDDRQGSTYVAAIEAKNYPIYGVQFHPEKNPYEIGDDKTGGAMNLVDHSYEAIVISQTFAHFFIQEARRNAHAYSNPEVEGELLLLNPSLSKRSYPYFESTLVFPLKCGRFHSRIHVEDQCDRTQQKSRNGIQLKLFRVYFAKVMATTPREQRELRIPILGKPTFDSRTRGTCFAVPLMLTALILFVLGLSMPRSHQTMFSSSKRMDRPVVTRDPIIAVHSHQDPDFGDEFIAASYIKWIESAGGRAVRIGWNSSREEVIEILSNVNGLLFPGGDPDPNDSAAFMYEYAIELNKNGSYFPVWGTCLGFEWLLQLQSGNMQILDSVDAENISSTLNLIQPGTTRLFSSYSSLFQVLATEPIADNFHHLGILEDHFYSTPSLTSFFRVLATSVDRIDQTYVAAIEALDYPIYGVQFHPEKNPYEFGENFDGSAYESIDHQYAAIMTSQAFAHFFIGEARKNGHTFSSAGKKQASLLYNKERSNRSYPMYEEVFVFN